MCLEKAGWDNFFPLFMHFFFEIKKSAFITYQPSCKQEPSEVYKLVGVIRVFGLLVRLIAIMF